MGTWQDAIHRDGAKNSPATGYGCRNLVQGAIRRSQVDQTPDIRRSAASATNVLIMSPVHRFVVMLVACVVISAHLLAQTPQPFPRPGTPAPSSSTPASPAHAPCAGHLPVPPSREGTGTPAARPCRRRVPGCGRLVRVPAPPKSRPATQGARPPPPAARRGSTT